VADTVAHDSRSGADLSADLVEYRNVTESKLRTCGLTVDPRQHPSVVAGHGALIRICRLIRLQYFRIRTTLVTTTCVVWCVCIQGGLIFVCGSREGLMEVTARRHNTDDIIATVLAVEPMKFIYRGR